ncbi:MAG: hypothetical protein ACK5P7_12065 [Bdellovibrio sp.]
MTVLMLTAAVSIGFYFLSDQVIMQKQQIEKNASTLQLRLGLHSVVDYVLFGIKQRWCFGDTLMPDATCDLSHSASVERLLMSEAQENFIRATATSGVSVGPLPSGAISLQGFRKVISMSDLTVRHPLSTILSRIKSDDLRYIIVSVDRDNSSALPTSGREVYLHIKVTLSKNTTGDPLMYGTYPLTAASFTSVHPRELGSFALIVAGNMRLDKAFNESLPRGDVAFHKFANKSALGTSPGLLFESPVFVNRDVHMPFVSTNDRKASDLAYSPVTFAERIYMGDGRVYEGGAPYLPATSGAPGDQYWTDNKLFGGFLRGLENDGARDAGLDFVGRLDSGTVVDTTLAHKCTMYNLSMNDLNFIAQAELQVERLSASTTKSTFRMGLKHDIEFVPQSNTARGPSTNNWEGTQTHTIESAPQRQPIMEVDVYFENQRLTAQMTRNSKLTIRPEFFSNINDEISSRERELEQINDTISDLQTEASRDRVILADKQRDLNNVQDDLIEELAKNPRNNSKINRLRDQETDLKKDVAKYTREIADGEAAVDVANNKKVALAPAIESLNEQKINPPEMIIDVDTVTLGGNSQPHLSEIKFEFRNSQNMRNSARNIVAPQVYVKTYDGSFSKSRPVVSGRDNANLKGYFNFQVSGTDIVPPTGISKTLGTGPEVAVPTSTTDLFALAEKCNTMTYTTSGNAFGAAAWDFSFATRSRHSWNFTQDPNHPDQGFRDPLLDTLVFDGNNSAPGVTTFQVRSIVGECIIKSTATFITGFLTCDHLIIEPRNRPLRIIATIIASKATIDPTAFQSGIRWSSIYSPQATPELRAAGVLKSVSGAACNSGNSPIWHPVPSIIETADRYACYPVSLRLKADPFTWTTVDPDCGLLPGAPSTKCKKRLVRYFVVEQSRESGL